MDDRKVISSGVAKLFYEEQQTTPNGDTIWLSTSKMPLIDNDGVTIGMVGIYEDVTAKKMSEFKLKEVTQMLQDAQHIAHIGNWKLDLLKNELYWSDEIYKIFNVNKEETVTSYETFLSFVHPEDRELVDTSYKESLLTQKPYQVTHRLLLKDNVIKWVQEVGVSEFDLQGNAILSYGTVQDITQEKRVEKEMHTLAYYDTLTSLANKTLLLKNIQETLEHVATTQEYATLIFIDLDNFKILNDTMGHEIGDILLQEVAKRLVKLFHKHTTIARLGGDEFIISTLTKHRDYEGARNHIEQLIQNLLVALKETYLLRDIEYALTASIGITLYNDNTLSSDTLMKQADLAMYRSKELGRDTFTFFEPSMEFSLKEKTLLQEELLNAMQNNELVLFYQPQVDKDAKVLGAEALVRWNHPTKGLVSPALFIPLAEESEAIIKLGTIVLEKACHKLAYWATRPELKDLTLAVNISVKQFNESNFIPKVKELLLQTKINPKLLKFEITESLLVINEEMVITKMQELQELGILFSLDDFGTGYSSLTYLKKLPLDQLKIDQSFVRDITYDANDAIICQSTIAIANTMGLATIAEGVETSEQKNKLLELGCKHFQGYFFSQPLKSELFEDYVRGTNQL
jgi:diguanylate cyclase (GGDEF)-like protein/PAS domain S-box-containing protein